MKQIEINDDIRAKLKAAAGEDVDVSKLAVFRAAAMNTRPVRKKHPLYEDARHNRQFLVEMAAAVTAESIPLQLMHNTSALPIGRIFSGDVVDRDGYSELQTLFWIDSTHTREIDLVNNGTVDQVSVSVLAKRALSNKSGFDFFGDDADFEHIWTGTDPDGNVMGEDGAYVLLQDLDSWFEMSLVGQGGIPGARILGNGDLKLAASGQTVPLMTLTLSSEAPEPTPIQETSTMDLTALVEQLTSAKADLTVRTAELTQAQERNVALEAQVAQLTEQNDPAIAAARDTALATVATLSSALTDATKQIFTVCGEPDAQLPEGVEQLASTLVEKVKTLKLPNHRGALDASNGSGEQTVRVQPSQAFKRR